MEDFIKKLHEAQAMKKQKIEECLQKQHELDTVVNFKVNSTVKKEFERICKENHSNLSRELKVFMLAVIKQGRL